MIQFTKHNTLLALTAAALLLSACASPNGPPGRADVARPNSGASRISICKSTDTQVDSSSQCLQDDAACYELSNGKWCTGERGNTCPAGSNPLAAGVACPPGKRCFHVGESLECAIN